MLNIFDFRDYRTFIRKRFAEMPKRGYGQANKMALYLNVHTTLISQMLKGLKTLTLEQASLTADYLGLNDMEADFFLLLVQLDRAGNESLRKRLKQQILQLKNKSADLINRLQSQKKLSEEVRAVFYSDWTYSAVRQLCAIKGFQTVDAISNYFGFSTKQTKRIVSFLLSSGLCKEEKDKIVIGPASTHLESASPWVRIHHINWRQKALDQINFENENKLHYSCPLTISKSDAEKLRGLIIKFLDETDKVIEPSPSEVLYCLNVDWFKVDR